VCLSLELFGRQRHDLQDRGAITEYRDRLVNFGVVTHVIEPYVAIDGDSFLGLGHDPLDRHVFIDGNEALIHLVLPIAGSSVDAELVLIAFPVKNHLVCRVSDSKVCGVGLRHNRYFDRWPK